ncbi:MAG: hypothetical protein H7Y39_03410 [Nitrospiraceae bacterium]|nr:hypothetical protein [Nitrospiraceae bacterium]
MDHMTYMTIFSSLATVGMVLLIMWGMSNVDPQGETINLAWASASYKRILDASVLVESKGYPSSENLKIVFHKLGVSIFTECNRKMRTDVAALIDSIGDLRSEMAHLGVPSGITENDVEKKIKDLRNIVVTIDRIVHEQF